MKLQKDYSFIRGFCYGWQGSPADFERDLGYAERLSLNSMRIWLRYDSYVEDPGAFIAKLKELMRIGWSKGISTMPILFNGNMFDIAILEESWRDTGGAYVKRIVEAIKDEEGLIMWDIMNEPSCNDYIRKAEGAEAQARRDKMWSFVRYFCNLVKTLDPDNPVTVGHTFIEDVEPTADCVDVLSFHDYLETTARINHTYDEAEALSQKTGKPLINSELCCLCRANPYDLSLQICQERKVGWYLFELMIQGYWGDVHGIVYPDGTVRDPSIVAAVMGFFRNRDPKSRIKPNANKEGNVNKALGLVKDALTDDVTLFLNKKTDATEILEAAEWCVNFLEGCELVPMYDPPSVQLKRFREQEDPNLEEVRAWAYDLAIQLKKFSNIL